MQEKAEMQKLRKLRKLLKNCTKLREIANITGKKAESNSPLRVEAIELELETCKSGGHNQNCEQQHIFTSCTKIKAPET